MDINNEKNSSLNSPLINPYPQRVKCKIHRDADEDSIIQYIEPYQYSKLRGLLFWILVILTCGILFLIDRWFLNFHIAFRYARSGPAEATHLLVKSQYFLEFIPTAIKQSKILGTILTFKHHYLQYYFDGKEFQPLYFDISLGYKKIIDKYSHGYIENEEIMELKALFGACQIIVPLKTIPSLVWEEVLHPFYIFQVFSVGVWYFEQYFLFSGAIICITLISLSTNVYQTRKSMSAIHKLAKRSINVNVLREGSWNNIESPELVPGDVIQIPQGCEMPCDVALISGGCIIDEGTLTGESVPVIKDSLPYLDEPIYSIENDKRYSLYEGTKVIQTRNYGGAHVIGIVTRIGFSTMKGKMVRSILFPKPNKFKFYRDSMLFVGVLSIIAMTGFLICMPIMIYIGIPLDQVWVRCLDIITITVPPSLPACMNVGTAFAISRLRKNKIFCIAPPRVNVAGKIDIYCFDKTGTLTEDGMILVGIQPCNDKKMEALCDDPQNIEKNSKNLIECMASCHSLTMIDQKIVGDTQDVQIFNCTKWIFEEPDEEIYEPAVKAVVKPKEENEAPPVFDDDGNVISLIEAPYELGILHIFHFTSKLKRMGVITKNLKENSFQFYMKGAPEVVIEKCIPSSIPNDIKMILGNYTCAGYRVLACCYKNLAPIKYSDLKSQKLEELETDLIFLGLIVLQNKLKPQTMPVIRILHKVGIKTIMSTGDAVLTGISVARECAMIDPEATVYLGEMHGDRLLWQVFRSIYHEGDSEENELNIEPPWCSLGFDANYALALTGASLAYMAKLSDQGDSDSVIGFKIILEKCRVFARMSPEHKTLLIEKIQKLGYLIGMCGDGANDCGALKSADIGISLSEKEASIAAPFTSQISDISCVITVLKEGRCALTTSTQCFKFMFLYSTIQFITVSMLYSMGTCLTNNQFVTFDMVTMLPLAITMSKTGPYHKLSKRHPTASLMSVAVLTSVIGQTVLEAITQVLTYLIANEMAFFKPNDYKPGEPITDFFHCDPNTVLFLVSWFEYEAVCFNFNIGKPWKKPLYTNALFTIVLIALISFTFYSILYPDEIIRDIYDLTYLPWNFRYILTGICLGYGLCTFLFEKYIVSWADMYYRKRMQKKKHAAKVRDLYLKK